MIDIPPPAYECVATVAEATSVMVVSGLREDVASFRAAVAHLPAGWVLEAHASSPNRYAFLRYRLPTSVDTRNYVLFRQLAARHRLAVSSATVDPPLCPLPGETEADALGPPAPVGWVSEPDAALPEPEMQLILHGRVAEVARAVEAARRIGWRVVSEATGRDGDGFAVIASRGSAAELEERMLVALSRLRVDVGMIFPLASDASAD
jgi:hypothetical protein